MKPSEVLGLIKDKEVKFVDFRFTDTKGKEQHVTVPAHTVDEDLFEEGKMFDGSSIAGWKGINESDMILLPDPSSAVIDIFTDEETLNLRCNVIEPATMQGYDRCPRSLAERAEAYMKSTGIADTAFFGPTQGTGRRSREAISLCHPSIRCTISVPRCVLRWRSSASRPRFTTTKSPRRASARSA
jgi:glutamine synthetase